VVVVVVGGANVVVVVVTALLSPSLSSAVISRLSPVSGAGSVIGLSDNAAESSAGFDVESAGLSTLSFLLSSACAKKEKIFEI